jgi:SSS family solute:Na+ symporter
MRFLNNYIRLVRVLFLALVLISTGSVAQERDQLKWQAIPGLQVEQPVSGAMLVCVEGRLLVAGGKIGGQSLELISNKSDKNGWVLSTRTLPVPIANGHTVSYKNISLIIGGDSNGRPVSSVYVLRYKNNVLSIDSLPALPQSLTGVSGGILGDWLIIAGGRLANGAAVSDCWAYDLRDFEGKWIKLENWPGPARSGAKVAVLDREFYLFGGEGSPVSETDGRVHAVLKDAYKFSATFRNGELTGGHWTKLPDVPVNISGAPSVLPRTGLHHILFPGAGGSGADSILAFNRESQSWINYGTLHESLSDSGSGGFSNAVQAGNTWVLLARHSDSNNQLALYSLEKKLGFGLINWTTLVIYLACMVWIGFVTGQKSQSTDNFFNAGGRIPSWAAGLSIYGTQISAITFMAMPALVYATDWTLMIGSVMILPIVYIVARYYIPFFRKVSVTSAYEYLEHRFSGTVRLLGSLSFILFQMGRMGIVLYLPAVAIASVTGIDIYLLITIMGVICIIYTVMGGIEAVVWTDVAQVVILMGGAILCLVIAIINIDGGLAKLIDVGLQDHKFTLFKLGWDASDTVLWVCIVGFFFLNIIPYSSDQSVVQRYFTVKDEKEAARSLWVNAWVTMPGTLVFFGLGTALYVFYKENPAVIASDKVDEILPYFVVQQLPAGISGLVIAGIFAASQSTLSSSMNSIAASYFTDIHSRYFRGSNRVTTLKIAQIITVISGLFGTVSAMLIVALNVQFAFDLFQEVLGILGGSLAGVFILGIFTKRANAGGVFIGLIAGVLAVWLVRGNSNISVYLYGGISVMVCVVVGYITSFFFKPKAI